MQIAIVPSYGSAAARPHWNTTLAQTALDQESGGDDDSSTRRVQATGTRSAVLSRSPRRAA